MSTKNMLRSVLCLVVTLALLAGGSIGVHQTALATWTPCDDVTDAPDPPSQQPQPLIGGKIMDSDTSNAVSGATVKLYSCSSGVPVLIDTETTDGSGEFNFSSLSGPDWYFVEVLATGPLSGMSESAGTINPSELINVGPGEGDLLFEFES